MKVKHSVRFATNYLRATAFVTASIGIFLLFWPEMILQLFIPYATGDFFIRFIGSALLGYSTLNYLASRSNELSTFKIALDSNIVTLFIATVISIVGVMNGSIIHNGSLIIVEHIFFLSLFGWARYKIT